MKITDHAEVRMAQRGITEQDIETVMQYGHCLRRTGVTFYFMRRKDIRLLSRSKQTLLHGLTAVISRNGTLMTVYKNVEALSKIKKKHKYKV